MVHNLYHKFLEHFSIVLFHAFSNKHILNLLFLDNINIFRLNLKFFQKKSENDSCVHPWYPRIFKLEDLIKFYYLIFHDVFFMILQEYFFLVLLLLDYLNPKHAYLVLVENLLEVILILKIQIKHLIITKSNSCRTFFRNF